MSLPTPTKILRADGITLWQYDFTDQKRSVSIQATTQRDADTAIQAYLDAQTAPAKIVIPPLAAAIAALETLDQSKPATIGDVVSALKAIIS